MKVQVIRSNRKTIGLEVRADESVILRAPQWLSEKELDEWIGEHAYWIEEKVKQMRQRNLNKSPALLKRAIPHKDCATDASSNFSSDETKSGVNT